MLDGVGTRTYSNGTTLLGTWRQNQLVKGNMMNTDETSYQGQWLGGIPHGVGKKVISDSKCYEGMFLVGRPWG